MLGTVRTFLALLVVAAHFGRWTDLRGADAVQSFFVISGFMMTATLHKNYDFRVEGIVRFLKNRLWRIYPQYWVAAIFSLTIVALYPVQALHAQRNLVVPQSTSDWVKLVANWYWRPDFTHVSAVSHLVPPAWALSVEFVMYLVLALFASRSMKTGISLLAFGVGYHLFNVNDVNARLYDVAAASFSYGLGICTYFFTRKKSADLPARYAMMANVIYFCIIGGLNRIPLNGSLIPFYTNIFLTSAITSINMLTSTNDTLLWIDTKIGSLSYPIYLIHYQCAALVLAVTARAISGWALFAAAFPLIVIVSGLLEALAKLIIEPKRARIRAYSRQPVLTRLHRGSRNLKHR